MGDEPESDTHVTLLGRLRRYPTDEAAWREFVRHYGAKVLVWCRAWGLQEADVEEVYAQVLFQLTEAMRTFAYDPQCSFRAWLKTVARNALSNWARSWDRHGSGSGDDAVL